MLRDILCRGKELADKVTNIVLNYTEVEAEVREATSDKACFPHGKLMQKLADYTFSHETYVEVMGTLWKRMHPHNNRNWRRIYKSLIVLVYLLKNGSEYVAQGASEHIYDIRTLESFHYYDEYGKDQGLNVRIKVQEVIELILDSEKLKQERQKAKSSRNLYTGYGNSSSKWDSSYGRRDFHQDRISYDDEVGQPRTRQVFHSSSSCDSPPEFHDSNIHRASETKSTPRSEFANPRLGSFEDWHVGRERGVIDDVVETFKEAWDMAKLSTKDLPFFKKPQTPPFAQESNPRMISEEMYEFPSDAVEVDGTIDSAPLPRPVYNPIVGEMGNSNLTKSQSSMQNQHSSRESTLAKTAEAKKPRPPSGDLIDPLANGRPCVAPIVNDLLYVENKPPPSNNSNGIDLLSTWSTNDNSSLIRQVDAANSQSDLLNNEFGEFTSVKPSSLTTGSSCLLTNVDLFPPINNNLNVSTNWAVKSTNASSATFLSTSGVSFSNGDTSSQFNSTSPSMSPQSFTNAEAAPVSNSINLGSTWQDLGVLGIDLNNLAKPEKSCAKQTRPSLLELKQTQLASTCRLDQTTQLQPP